MHDRLGSIPPPGTRDDGLNNAVDSTTLSHLTRAKTRIAFDRIPKGRIGRECELDGDALHGACRRLEIVSDES